MAVGRTSSTGLPWLVASSDLTNGSDIIYPTSVAGSGVTLSGGEVSFSAATTVSVNGCFTSTYQNYQVLIAYSVSASAFVNSRYRSAGTDDSASNYFQQYLSAVNTAVGGLSSTATSQYTAFAASTDPHYSVVQISGPNLAAQTSLLAANLRSDGIMHFSCKKNTTTQYDGFSLIPASGTVTGKMRIYGMRNS